MGATYTRQSTYSDGDVITAAHTNDEFNQLLAAFQASTGHTHDGTANEGGPITKMLGTSLTLGDGTSGTDITVTFDGETNDGVLKWMEDEDYFEFSDDILVASTEKIQFRDTAIYINSSADGQLDLVADTEIQIAATTIDMNGAADISGNLAVGGNLTVAGNATVTGTTTFNGGTLTLGDAASDNVVFGADVNSSIIPNGANGSFDLGSSSQEWRDLFINGTAHIDTLDVDENATVTGNLSVGGNLDVTGTFDLSDSNFTNAGDIQLDSITGDSDTNTSITFSGSDVITVTTGGETQVTFNNGSILPTTNNDVDLGSDALEFKDIYIDGTAYLDAIDFNGTAIAATAAELNIIDGDTSATSTTVADADRVVLNDNGTMVQVAVTDLAAYFDDEITAMPNLVTTAATTVGALNSGSITSGFGAIDIGSSTITTTGLISGGSLDIDNVLINGTTIGHTDDTDLITLADGIVTVAGEVSLTTLDIGGTNVTSTAAELNILDGVTSTTAELNILDGVTSTAAELNILDVSNSTIGDLSEISTIASDDVFLAIDTSGGGLKKVARSTVVSGLAASDAISSVVEDTSPQLGGNLDVLARTITTSTSNGNIAITPNGSGVVLIDGQVGIEAGIIDLKNSGSTVSKILFYCESSNAHAQTLIGAPHSESASNTLTLPSTGGNSRLLSAASTATLTNKTLTSPKINEDVAVTSTATELNLLDGVTSTTAELNILDGVTSTAAELNILDGVTSTAAELNILDGVTSTAAELNIIDGDTSATSTTIVDADRLVLNDNGTMVQVAVTDVDTYVSATTKTLTNKTLTTPIMTGPQVKNGATSAGFIQFFEDSDNGTNKVTLIGPASTADVTLTLPAAAGIVATTDDATALAIALG